MLTNRFKTGLWPVFAILLFTGCIGGGKLGSISTDLNGALCLTVPPGFREVGNLHDHSDFQFENSEKGVYLVGLTDRKRDIQSKVPHFSRRNYLEFVIRTVKPSLENSRIASLTRWVEKGYKNTLCEIEGSRMGRKGPVAVTYTILISEDAVNFYQITSWSQRENNDYLCPMMENLMASANQYGKESGSEAQGASKY